MSKLYNKKLGGKDSIDLLKQMYKESNHKVKSLLKEHYSLHYSVSKSRTKRESVEVLNLIQNTKENKSEAMLAVPSEDVQANESLKNRINYLRSEIGELKQFKETAETKDKELTSIRSKYNELNVEYKNVKETVDRLQNDLNYAQNTIKDNLNTNKTLHDTINALKEEKRLMDGILSKNKESQYDNIKEYRDALARTKNACEIQISNAEKELKNRLQDVNKVLLEKEQTIKKLEALLNDFKSNILVKLEINAKEKVSKLNEIQNLNSRIKDLKSTINELTQDKETVENKLKHSQNLVKDLQQKLKLHEDEIMNIKKTADEQETIANSLYENRLDEKNREIEKLEADLSKKEEQAAIDHYEKDKAEQNLIREKALKDKIELVLEKYRTFSVKVSSYFKYEESFTHEDEERCVAILDGLFKHLQILKKTEKDLHAQQMDEHAKGEVAKLKQVYEFQSSNKTNQEIEKLLIELSDKKMEIGRLNDSVLQYKQENEGLYKDREDLEVMVGEKNEVISGHMKTLESMRTTILTLRDNLKSAFDDVENNKKEINKYKDKFSEIEETHTQNLNDQRVSLLSTINSHFIAAGFVDSKENSSNSNPPSFESLFEAIVNKIRHSKDSKETNQDDTSTLLENII